MSDREETSEFPAINSLRKLIKEDNKVRVARRFINELQEERERAEQNHLTVTFEGGTKLSVDNHTGCIVLKNLEGKSRDNISEETHFAILNELSGKKIVRYAEIDA